MSAFLLWLKRSMCSHVFRGCDIGVRDDTGMVDWACHKCGKAYREPCGLDFTKHGTITGPWGVRPEEKSA